MVSVGISTNEFGIRFSGDGVNCDASQIKNLFPVTTSAFPATMTRMAHHNIAFATDTSTLVACGGNQVVFQPIVFLYYFFLN
jgi:hypothetical protein